MVYTGGRLNSQDMGSEFWGFRICSYVATDCSEMGGGECLLMVYTGGCLNLLDMIRPLQVVFLLVSDLLRSGEGNRKIRNSETFSFYAFCSVIYLKIIK